MKTPIAFCITLLSVGFSVAQAQEINNADFSKGKAGWLGDGKVVYIDDAGAVSEKPSPGATTAIRIELSKTGWKSLKQKLHPKTSETEIKIAVQVKAEATFKRLPESRAYSDVNFTEGGQWVWSAEVYPKCDFLVRVKDEGWSYRPMSLAPMDAWKTVTESFPNLKGRQREIELLCPPGEGAVLIKGAK